MESSIDYHRGYIGKISKNSAINILIGGGLLCCVLTSELPLTIYCSLFLVVIFYCYAFVSSPILYLKYLHYIFASSIAVAGCAIIELFDIDLWEISDHSAFNGSLPLLSFSWWILLTTIMTHDVWLSNKLKRRKYYRSIRLKDTFNSHANETGVIIYTATALGFLLIVYTFVKVLPNPSFAIGVDRFSYSELFDYGFLYGQANRFIKYLIIPCIVVSIYKKNKIGWAALAVYCLHSFWTGNKFGSFFSLLCTFMMIYSEKIATVINNKKGSILAVGALTISLIFLSVFAVSFTSDSGGSNYLFSRLAQQGQLWWKTYDISNTYHFSEFGDEVRSIKKGTTDIAENTGAKYGIYKIMYYTAPKTQIDAKLQTGSRYTEAGFAAAYYYLGIPGCVIFAVLGGVLVSTFANYFLFFLRYNQYLRAFIHLRFYTNMAVLMSMFVFFPYFNKTSTLSYLILLLGSNKIFAYGHEQI